MSPMLGPGSLLSGIINTLYTAWKAEVQGFCCEFKVWCMFCIHTHIYVYIIFYWRCPISNLYTGISSLNMILAPWWPVFHLCPQIYRNNTTKFRANLQCLHQTTRGVNYFCNMSSIFMYFYSESGSNYTWNLVSQYDFNIHVFSLKILLQLTH